MNYSSTFQGLPGYWSRGKFYPIIAGGSDAATSAAAMISGGTEGGSGDGAGDGSASQGSQDNSFAREVLGSLEGVDDSERPILEKYLSGIDAQVNQRFQSIHEQYAPFKGMDPDSVDEAMKLSTLIQANPEGVFQLLAEGLGYELEGDEFEDFEDGEEGEEGSEYDEGEEGGFELPPELAERLDRHDEILEALAEQVLGSQQKAQEAQEAEQLDEELESLHDEYGDFDDELALSYAVANEIDLKEAVEYVQSFAQKLMENNQPPTPKPPGITLSGSGIPPQNGEVDPTKLDDKATKSLVAQLLQAAEE